MQRWTASATMVDRANNLEFFKALQEHHQEKGSAHASFGALRKDVGMVLLTPALMVSCPRMELKSVGFVLDIIRNLIAQLSMDSLPSMVNKVNSIKAALEEMEVERRVKVIKRDLLCRQPHRTEKGMDKKVMGPTPREVIGPNQKERKDPDKMRSQLSQIQLHPKTVDAEGEQHHVTRP